MVVPSPDGHLSTPEVYRHWDELHPDAASDPAPADALLAALATGTRPRAGRGAAQRPPGGRRSTSGPTSATLIERGEAEGALRGMVSGSGPTCVFLCESGDHARAVAGGLLGVGHDTVLTAYGPVAGAHVVEPADGEPRQPRAGVARRTASARC